MLRQHDRSLTYPASTPGATHPLFDMPQEDTLPTEPTVIPDSGFDQYFQIPEPGASADPVTLPLAAPSIQAQADSQADTPVPDTASSTASRAAAAGALTSGTLDGPFVGSGKADPHVGLANPPAHSEILELQPSFFQEQEPEPLPEFGDSFDDPASPPRKKVRHRNLFIKKDESAISPARHHELSRTPAPPLAAGCEHYIVSKEGDYFNPHGTSSRDQVLHSIATLSALPPYGCDDGSKGEYSTELYSSYRNPQLARAAGHPQFWVMSLIIECVELDRCDSLLLQGRIQHALRVLHPRRTGLVDRLLIILLRLVCGSRKHVKLLRPCSSRIFDLLCMVLWRGNERTRTPIVRRDFADSRAYSCLLSIAFAAHSRPLLEAVDFSNPRETALHKNHIRAIYQRYNQLFTARPRDYAPLLPPALRAYDDTFTTHDLAIEIFLELVYHNILTEFVPRFTEKFIKLARPYLESSPPSETALRLYYHVLKKPRMFSVKLQYPFMHYKQLYAHVRFTIENILAADTPAAALAFPSAQHAVLCARSLVAMQRWPLKYTRAYMELARFLSSSGVVGRLTQFVLNVPRHISLAERSATYQLYSTVWTLLWGMHRFPVTQFREILEAACAEPDQQGSCVDAHRRGCAAVFVAVKVLFNKVPIRRSQLVAVYNCLEQYTMRTADATVQKWYTHILFRISLVLSTEQLSAVLDVKSRDWDSGIASAFTSYTFIDNPVN